MQEKYSGVTTSFLHENERLFGSHENEMPLVIRASKTNTKEFLYHFLQQNSEEILNDIAKYGAVLLRGFAINSDQDFEDAIQSIKGFSGISDAFLSEQGRTHVNGLKYVLHTNSVYKTGGTLYLGGFHSENYYSFDVPSYICFCCHQSSTMGGETGLINMEKIYEELDENLKKRLAEKPFFVDKWLLSDVALRYNLTKNQLKKICKKYDIPIIGKQDHEFILMYKPSIFTHPVTEKKSMQINLFEVLGLNEKMREVFMNDYQGRAWFWHRLVWRLPASVLKLFEYIYMIGATIIFTPKDAIKLTKTKLTTYLKAKKLPKFAKTKVGNSFTEEDVQSLAKLIRKYYSSCLWQKGDILLVDNKKVMHAGMPGKGPRSIRALICNPLEMQYRKDAPSTINCIDRKGPSIGSYVFSKDSARTTTDEDSF